MKTETKYILLLVPIGILGIFTKEIDRLGLLQPITLIAVILLISGSYMLSRSANNEK